MLRPYEFPETHLSWSFSSVLWCLPRSFAETVTREELEVHGGGKAISVLTTSYPFRTPQRSLRELEKFS
ncbi:hypothetical protein E2C01_097703 [Portunus trituberculatus]|uniref:Uncharacterized protein n=1 Tax=Portunus trituberculatus TaxID=210409 RepID=A0A5B7K6F6_PORTR|nr:hypothetical protein [Portunus trituberculatus]